MSRDMILTSEAGVRYSYDNICSQHYLEGHAPGCERAEGYLRERAARLFTAGKDVEAIAMRKLADELRGVGEAMEEEARKHALEYPEIVPDRTGLCDCDHPLHEGRTCGLPLKVTRGDEEVVVSMTCRCDGR